MSLDPRIVCFKHCDSRAIFCKEVPFVCPLCNLAINDYALEPFRLPNPFVNAKESPTTITIRPSRGDFLNDYKVTEDLHIGIVDSEGRVFEFDKPGILKNDFTNWKNCLALKIVPESWTEHWDLTLETVCNDKKWSSLNYREDSFNCFNFVIEFLNELKYDKVKFNGKENFCRHFLIPRIQDALKFVKFYRKLKNVDYFVSN